MTTKEQRADIRADIKAMGANPAFIRNDDLGAYYNYIIAADKNIKEPTSKIAKFDEIYSGFRPKKSLKAGRVFGKLPKARKSAGRPKGSKSAKKPAKKSRKPAKKSAPIYYKRDIETPILVKRRKGEKKDQVRARVSDMINQSLDAFPTVEAGVFAKTGRRFGRRTMAELESDYRQWHPEAVKAGKRIAKTEKELEAVRGIKTYRQDEQRDFIRQVKDSGILNKRSEWRAYFEKYLGLVNQQERDFVISNNALAVLNYLGSVLGPIILYRIAIRWTNSYTKKRISLNTISQALVDLTNDKLTQLRARTKCPETDKFDLDLYTRVRHFINNLYVGSNKFKYKFKKNEKGQIDYNYRTAVRSENKDEISMAMQTLANNAMALRDYYDKRNSRQKAVYENRVKKRVKKKPAGRASRQRKKEQYKKEQYYSAMDERSDSD